MDKHGSPLGSSRSWQPRLHSAALRPPISSRRFSLIRKTSSPFQFSFVPSSLPLPSSFTSPRLVGSVSIGDRIFPRLPAAKQQVDQVEVGFDQQPSQELAIASACLVGVLTGISVGFTCFETSHGMGFLFSFHLLLQLEGGKKMASEVLFDRKDFSTSGVTLNAACRTSSDKAFHTDVLPAKCVKIGLQ